MNTFFKTTLLLLVLLFISCDSDDDNTQSQLPQGEFDFGFFVLNEGGFGGSGEVTYISNEYDRVEQNIFSAVNPSEDIGIFPQSIFFDDKDNAYIIANGSALITVVNRFTLEKVAEITTNLDNPRYGQYLNGKAYVTNQASFTTSADDFVTVIDAIDFSVETTISLMDAAEFITTDGSRLFVQNASFGSGNHITVINPEDNSIVTKIETNTGLQNMAVNASSLYALHTTGIDIINFNTLEVNTTRNLPTEINGATNLKIYEGNFYYTYQNAVYKSSLANLALSGTPLLNYNATTNFSLYGFAVNNGLVYIADAVDFASDGFINVYDTNGNLIFETSVGLSPNGFYFN